MRFGGVARARYVHGRARRQRQLDAHRLGRRLAAGHGVGVGERAGREPGDVREPVGVDGGDADARRARRVRAPTSPSAAR